MSPRKSGSKDPTAARKVAKKQQPKNTKRKQGCGCKKSGCLKNYCECYEFKIPCSAYCKCLGCKNTRSIHQPKNAQKRLEAANGSKKGATMLTKEVIETIVGCLFARAELCQIHNFPPSDVQFELLMQFNRAMGIVLAGNQH